MDFITKTVSQLSEVQSVPLNKHKNIMPDRKEIVDIIRRLQAALFPDFFKVSAKFSNPYSLISDAYQSLTEQMPYAYALIESKSKEEIDEICVAFIEKLPKIKDLLLKDIKALYDGDPAASCYEEVILCYPGFYATSIYRIAHELYLLGVPLIPRMMTEYAHEKTGIDIHAGATIGEYFFIDHGTGIVIGETTVIGDHVKLYQGVTLGAKSFELDESGNPVKGIKRHPNIGNHVVIYANATILGGDTTIGDNSTIGASVWLTSSVEPNKRVYYTATVTSK